ncbi:MAG: glycerol-3-phosphate 1-O-acyltransferase PlsY [Coriobacteriales bacterium]|jgi:glycerol-3-phosphate acyltransferase PlsY|nr:glycerol-3-phosphate 1-O-acyltransferase PlsY [Coriobacteriales bacterium]
MTSILTFAVVSFLVGFLLGSIPWGVIISKLFFRTDIREHGSGNIGTTNAFRTMGPVGGVAVFSLDFLKGLLAGGLAMIFAVLAAFDVSSYAAGALVGGAEPLTIFGVVINDTASLTALNTHVFGLIQGLGLVGCISGHIFSPWLHFKGGKGIAVAVGCLFFVFGWQGALVSLGIFIALVIITRIISIGSIAAAVTAPGVAFWVSDGEPFFVLMAFIAGGLVVWAHRANIVRLRTGNEPKIGSKKAAS